MRYIRYFFISLLLLIFLFSLAAGSITVYSLHTTPIVANQKPLSSNQIQQVKNLIKANNPSNYKIGEKHKITLSEKQLNLLFTHALKRFDNNLRSKIRLFDNSIYITSSLKIPSNPIGQYINISSELIKVNNLLKIKSLNLGSITIPDFIANILLEFCHKELKSNYIEYTNILNSIIDFNLKKQYASINYVWNPGVAHKIKQRITSSIISPDLQNRIKIYSNQLALTSQSITDSSPSIIKIINPLFKFASQRSKNNDPIEENRALLITLGAHMLNKNVPLLLGDRSASYIKYRNYKLQSRHDLSKHFFISAAIVAISDPNIAHAIGLEKEIEDSYGGSGFSFADLAADRAGVTLAKTSLSTSNEAKYFQRILARTNNENDFMPSILSLKEGLQNIDFKTLYKNTNSKEYKMALSLIDNRIKNCSIYIANR